VPIGIELRRQSILVNELIVGGLLRVAHYILIAVVFFGDPPDVCRSRHFLGKDEGGKEWVREETHIYSIWNPSNLASKG
jgi:hypothetical protein